MCAPPGQGPLRLAPSRAMIHDGIPEGEEARCVEGLREEVCNIEVRAYEWHLDLHILHTLAHEHVSPVNMLHAGVMLQFHRGAKRRGRVD